MFCHAVTLPCAEWNGEDALEDMKETILTLQLPDLELSDCDEESWGAACAELNAYLCAVTETGEGAAYPLFSRCRSSCSSFVPIGCLQMCVVDEANAISV